MSSKTTEDVERRWANRLIASTALKLVNVRRCGMQFTKPDLISDINGKKVGVEFTAYLQKPWTHEHIAWQKFAADVDTKLRHRLDVVGVTIHQLHLEPIQLVTDEGGDLVNRKLCHANEIDPLIEEIVEILGVYVKSEGDNPGTIWFGKFVDPRQFPLTVSYFAGMTLTSKSNYESAQIDFGDRRAAIDDAALEKIVQSKNDKYSAPGASVEPCDEYWLVIHEGDQNQQKFSYRQAVNGEPLVAAGKAAQGGVFTRVLIMMEARNAVFEICANGKLHRLAQSDGLIAPN